MSSDRRELRRGTDWHTRPGSALAWPLLALFSIGFGMWLIFAFSKYGERYAQDQKGWQTGGTHLIEITLIRQDADNLACASDVGIGALGCAYGSDRARETPRPDTELLRPYSTVDGEIFLGAGLWTEPPLRQMLPDQRFTVMCDFHITGVVKSVALRWNRKGPFDAPKHSLAAGTLSNCVFPP